MPVCRMLFLVPRRALGPAARGLFKAPLGAAPGQRERAGRPAALSACGFAEGALAGRAV